MTQIQWLSLLILMLINITCADVNNSKKIYEVKKTLRPIEISGNGTDSAWSSTLGVSDFSYPWRRETPPATLFKARWDERYLYFVYHADDRDIIAKTEKGGERDVVDSDRVEIFFKADDEMDPYYSLEMDALGRVLDTEGRFYRNIDFKWTWPEGHLILKASTNEEGYCVEGAISLSSLRDLGMLKEDYTLKAGLYRGEYVRKDGGKTEVKWISWVKPDSEKPDFHIPSSFGLLKLIE